MSKLGIMAEESRKSGKGRKENNKRGRNKTEEKKKL